MGRQLHDGFVAWAERAPERMALSVGGREVSYGELARLARAIARRLSSRGIKRNDRVAILAEKGVALYAAILGALMSGAAYVPLAPKYPPARLRIILEDADPGIVLHEDAALCRDVLGDSRLAALDIASCLAADDGPHDATPIAGAARTEELAYILFTSGSTGRPKGVMVRHRNAVAFVDWARTYFSISDEDRLAGHSDLTFDLSVFDTFVALSSGATLFPVIEPLDRTSPGRFIKANAITVWFSVPAVLSGMQITGEIKPDFLAGLRWMIFCGEALAPNPIRLLMSAAPGVRVANLYGPTEATVACSAFELTSPPPADADAVPIGWKTGGTHIFVWHDDGKTAGAGEVGEIYVAGDQVALGYFRNPGETAAKFVADPRNPGGGESCYRTGDIGEVRAEGPVFKGRRDLQIKFRGWRIETGDVERELSAIAGVAENAVSVIERVGRPDAFVAFVRQSAARTPAELLNLLRSRLPDYMMPTHVRIVDDFPRTLNGKVDRKRLAELF